ncbi:hypothetical protein [Deinococcus sp.]|uniref:hypothetical protein n=1 Tax=Deinococcus sp. TaxID=47478 RepID=UPI003C7BAEFE
MKRLLTLTALMAAFGTALSGLAVAAPLAANLPAGALMTLQTNGAGPTFDRLLGLVKSVAKDQALTDTAGGLGALFKGSIGNEATLGLFSVGSEKGGFTPALLAVSRVDVPSSALFKSLIPNKAGAKVGKYTFVRDSDLFVGLSGGLVYLSSDKGLLMSYLGRLTGKAAPRLNTAAAYAAPTKAVGEQELSLYFNFSAVAKVIRGQLGQVLLPRLLSPVVDALDTLGSYAAGFSTTDSGLEARSAHLPNPAGKDKPLYSILTHTTDFAVQTLIPASAEAVTASACANESAPYLGRWLTRFDLFDPSGFLTDSQLAAYLEQSARYLGDECATVTLAGGGRAGLNQTNPTASLDYSVTYQRVSDMDAAKAQLPGYVNSLNTAIQGLAGTVGTLGGKLTALSGITPTGKSRGNSAVDAAFQSTQAQLAALKKQIAAIRVVYGFRGDYLVMAYSQKALAAALDESVPVLADDTDFASTELNFMGVAGWSYGKAGTKYSPSDFASAFKSLETVGYPKSIGQSVSKILADLLNRYGGMSSQRTAEKGLILEKSVVRYTWQAR